MLAKYYGVSLDDLVIGRTAWKKPFLQITDRKQTHFNYSHTEQYFLIGFSENNEVGVDIEEVNGKHKSIELIWDCLAKEEKEYVQGLQSEERREALLKIWVQKEAVGKALGVGLLYDTEEIAMRADYQKKYEEFTVLYKETYIQGIVWRSDTFWACIAITFE